jgi:hypothetical protein
LFIPEALSGAPSRPDQCKINIISRLTPNDPMHMLLAQSVHFITA